MKYSPWYTLTEESQYNNYLNSIYQEYGSPFNMANEESFTDMFQWYEKLYPAVARSKVFSEYCIKLFGTDLSQQGFYTMAQLDLMLSKLNPVSDTCILEIGCGLGKFSEYISDNFGSIVYGIDYSPAAIAIVKERTKTKRKKLSFETGNINTIKYPENTFDIVLALDCIFFASDLKTTLKNIHSWLRPNGKLAVIYGVFRFDKSEPVEIMYANTSPLANAFHDAGFTYKVFDFTKQLYEHQLLKRKTVLELKQKFMDEGTLFLYEYLYRESVDLSAGFDEFREFASYYLYLYEKI